MGTRARGQAFVAGVVLVALVVAACGGGEEDAPATEAPDTAAAPAALHIGAVLPETGSLAFLGVPMIAAVRLAAEDVNAQGG